MAEPPDPFGRPREESHGGFLPPTSGPPPSEPGVPPPPRPPLGGAPGAGKATAALVLGILGLIACPPLFSTAAIVLGRRAKTELEAAGAHRGVGNATAGIVLGWLGLAFLVLFVLLLVAGAVRIEDGRLQT